MSGVDTALFVNDVCGQPLPWDHCCPWGFFDGKLFQSKLAKATRDRASLLEMCEGQVNLLFQFILRCNHPCHDPLLIVSVSLFPLVQEELVSRVDKMRQAILEGVNLSRPLPPPPPPPLPPPAFLPPAMVPPFYPMHPLYPPRPLGTIPPPHHQHRARAFPGQTSFKNLCTSMIHDCVWVCFCFVFYYCPIGSPRHPVHTSTRWQAGDCWHGCWSVGWKQTNSW